MKKKQINIKPNLITEGYERNYKTGICCKPYKRETPKIGRNELCVCGSGKKFKKCCLKN